MFITLVRFEELTDNQLKLLVPSIPPHAHTGRPRADDRNTVDSILYVLMSGCKWMHVPSKYAHRKQFGSDTRSGVLKVYGKIL
jgi:transposase